MTYSDIENALTTIAAGIQDESLEKAFKLVRPYESDFEGFQLPEDFTPREKYAFVDVIDEQGSSLGFASTAQIKGTGQVQIFVGDHANKFSLVKKSVHQRLEWIRKAVHGKVVSFEDGSQVKFQWTGNAKYFSLPNHVCWIANFTMTTQYRIDNV